MAQETQPPGSRTSIDGSFNPRHNSLNLLRLVLAGIVLYDHALLLGGFRSIGYLFNHKSSAGFLAVFGFFGISGYLIAGSASRNNVGRYLWQRALRILPAFWVCLVVVAGFFGLIAWCQQHPHCGVSCYVRAPLGPIGYVVRNSLLGMRQSQIAGTPRTIRSPLVWDGSLWSLYYEFGCYLVVAGLAIATLLRRRWTVAAFAAGLWGVEVVITWVPNLNHQFNILRHFSAFEMIQLLPVFLTGSLVYLYGDRIPDSGLLALACFTCFVLGLFVPLGSHQSDSTLTSVGIFAPALVYPLIWLGIHLPFHKVGVRNDYSYGVYIYAYPVSQLLALWGVYRWGYLAYSSLVVLMTIPFAAGSWWFIERRALRLKKMTWRSAVRTSSQGEPSDPGAVPARIPLGE